MESTISRIFFLARGSVSSLAFSLSSLSLLSFFCLYSEEFTYSNQFSVTCLSSSVILFFSSSSSLICIADSLYETNISFVLSIYLDSSSPLRAFHVDLYASISHLPFSRISLICEISEIASRSSLLISTSTSLIEGFSSYIPIIVLSAKSDNDLISESIDFIIPVSSL